MTSTPRSGCRGVLSLLGILFVLTAAARLAVEVLPAVATATPVEPVTAALSAAPVAQCSLSPVELAAALSEREARVTARETALAERMAAIDLAEDAIRGRLEALEAAEIQLRRTIAMADGAAEADLARLTAVYEVMKPKDAAALFDAMDAAFAAGFLGRMHAEAAAAVLAGMSQDKAYAASAILAGRNAAAPKE